MTPEAQTQTMETASANLPHRLLLVDDKVEDLLHYTVVLQHLGYEVKSCPSYTEAAEFFGRERFDLVIVNQGGNSFEGRTVLARAIEADRRMPVLVLTHLPSMACYVEAMQLGAFDYVQKPLQPFEMAELVNRHVRAAGPVPVIPGGAASQGDWTFGRTRNPKEN